MKYLFITIAALVLVGCGESQQTTPEPEAKPVEPVEGLSEEQIAINDAFGVDVISMKNTALDTENIKSEAASLEPPTAKAPDISIHQAAQLGNIEAVKQHLAAGTDANAKLDYVGTPLHAAAIGGHKEITELLIDKGADVNAKDDLDEMTPLHFAVVFMHKEIAELLIAKGADVNARNAERGRAYLTPLDMARNYPETASLLRKHGAKTG